MYFKKNNIHQQKLHKTTKAFYLIDIFCTFVMKSYAKKIIQCR